MTISEALALAGVILTAGGLIANQRWQKWEIERLEREIEKLRAWRHKVGEDPSHAAIAIAEMLDERIKELERRRK